MDIQMLNRLFKQLAIAVLTLVYIGLAALYFLTALDLEATVGALDEIEGKAPPAKVMAAGHFPGSLDPASARATFPHPPTFEGWHAGADVLARAFSHTSTAGIGTSRSLLAGLSSRRTWRGQAPHGQPAA